MGKTMTDPFESLLERMVPGSSRRGPGTADVPGLPPELGLEPRGVLGQGAVGWVFRAWDPVLMREVAVKVARPEGEAETRRLLLHEAQTTARLQHPAVLPVHRVSVAGGLLCVEFRLAPVTSMEALLVDWRADPASAWPLDRRLRCLRGVVSALECAHALGVVHGDLHPGNLAVGDQGEPYVLDWSDGDVPVGSLRGHPGFASPERLNGERAGTASDIWALGAVAWEFCTTRPMRPRRLGEDLGDYLARWSRTDPPALAELADPPAGFPRNLGNLCLRTLAKAPADRPTASEVLAELDALVGGASDRRRRDDQAANLLSAAEESFARWQVLSRRLGEERRVAAVQRAKVPGYAPIEQKRPLWDAEERVAGLTTDRDGAWVEAVESATRADALKPHTQETRALLSQLWWIRHEDAESRRVPREAAVYRGLIERNDDGRFTRILRASGQVTLTCSDPAAKARLYRFEDRARVLVPVFVSEKALPLQKESLEPGSWLFEVFAPGKQTANYPVHLGRLDHHRGNVRLFTPAEVGEGWVHVPTGPFRLGGDPIARQPLHACTPTLDDFFMLETCIRSDEWVRFLRELDPEAAARHVPGEAGLFGGFRAYWTREDDGGWTMPEGWDPAWPVMAVNVADVEAYAAWRSQKEGRKVRLPTEEEWEKAARGADGRSFPWGNGFDPTFARMRLSTPGTPLPSAVASFPTDRSVFGCWDMGGGMREWTSSLLDEGQMVIRGGTWGDDTDDLRSASRSGLQPEFRYSFVSFRLATEFPKP